MLILTLWVLEGRDVGPCFQQLPGDAGASGRALSSEAPGPSEWSLRTTGPCALHPLGRNPWEGGPWLQDRTGLHVGRGFGKESDQAHPSLWLPVSPLTVVHAGQRKCQQLTGPLLFTTFILKGPSQDS
uniref:Uncharacterized protein n=1 Tax=Rangifer tarandus platyrhynchus TaxID=3082113 RepID=A0ACB0FJ76_RANTA|nr:unnamed protein product [Rangifer tarandus platyrhynchus]